MSTKRSFSLLLLAASFSNALAVTPAASAETPVVRQVDATELDLSQSRSMRRVPRVPGRPIDQVLQPTDQDIDLTDLRDVERPLLDENRQVLPFLTKSSDLIALVEVTGVSSDLTQDRSWITSTATARIVELLKAGRDARERFHEGSLLSFPWEGGVAEIGPHRIQARIMGVRAVSEGKRYVVFGYFGNDDQLQIQPSTVYEVSGNEIRSMFEGRWKMADGIDSDRLDSLKRRIAAVLKGMPQ